MPNRLDELPVCPTNSRPNLIIRYAGELPQSNAAAAVDQSSSRYLKPSKLALHTTIQRIDAQRRASGDAAKWEEELAEIKKTLARSATKVPQTDKIGSETEFRKPRNR
jgi:septal ring factor EnvC (AmiA/AmiB activator)